MKKRKLLIIDDDEISASILAEQLRKRGYEAVYHHGPEFAVETLAERQIELVLLDLLMPGEDGNAILKKIRARFDKSQIPVIMVSGVDASVDIVAAFSLGANDYIVKPANIEIACSRIHAQLAAVDYLKESARKNELEAIRSIVITYNHEINNPLAIAMIGIEQLKLSIPEKDRPIAERSIVALRRIGEVVRKIREVSIGSSLEKEVYLDSARMVKLP